MCLIDRDFLIQQYTYLLILYYYLYQSLIDLLVVESILRLLVGRRPLTLPDNT
jgi:hypothetical protein